MRSPYWTLVLLATTACEVTPARPLRPVDVLDAGTTDTEHFRNPDAGHPSRRLSERPTEMSAKQLAPISGGTLLVTEDRSTAVVADPDRDRISIVSLSRRVLDRHIPLEQGDEPGRSIELTSTRIATVLRGAGAIAIYDPQGGAIDRVPVCAEPRGIAHDRAADRTFVVCKTGELVTLTRGATRLVSTRKIDLDLRDVWLEGAELRITRFKTAEVLVSDRDGNVVTRHSPPSFPLPRAAPGPDGSVGQAFEATVGWRAVPLPGGGAILAHQRSQTDPVVASSGGYGGSRHCDSGIVQSVLALVDASGGVRAGPTLVGGVLPVDVAVSADSQFLAVALAGSAEGNAVQVIRKSDVTAFPEGCAQVTEVTGRSDNEPVAVGFTATNQVIVQYRDPAVLTIGQAVVELGGGAAGDTGHLVFHMNAGAGIACASCHPEGDEDGHTWSFDRIGARRTQSLTGGILGSEPFHWNGDMQDFSTLSHEVFSSRMGGPLLRSEQVHALSRWVDRIPIPARPTPRDPTAVDRGRIVFERQDVGCVSCHSGVRFQSFGSFDVGTGELLQVPSLRGVVYRAPLLHTGCAEDLAARFGHCGSESHGRTGHLSTDELDDMIQYLETL